MTPQATPSVLLTSLLNSLQSHLQAQTQHLPTLHAQLGLPATALEDELRTLQNNLMQSVEAQIDLRRKEVDVWMEKCDSVENECLKYSKALGGNIKATGSSVGELRKENVLPKRYELGTEYQEKLRQLYHTKLEQLTNLTNRLNALARTLDRGFFSQDILEPIPACEDGDSTSHRDVTPERFSRLEKELVRGKGEITKRLNHLSETFEEIYILYMELGISPPTLEDLESVPSPPPYTSSASSSSLGKSLRPPQPSTDPFIMTPTPASRTSKSHSPLLGSDDSSAPAEDTSDIAYQRIFANFVASIEEAEAECGGGRSTATSSSAPLGLHNVDPTPSLISWAHTLQSNLDDTKRRRQAHIQAMFDQLEGLWRRLGVADEDMEAFVEVNKGTTEECVNAYEEELDRMLELKRERMSVFVGNAREEIERLWEELMTGEEERGAFGPFTDDEHTEELLLIHEEEIRKLKEEKRIKAPLLNSIRKYFEICEEEKELAAAASDQTRLLGRGARDPGRLLREEKMRKRVMKEKPRLEQDLLTTIPAWEQDTGRPFLVHGQSILRVLMDTISAADQENMSKRRQGGPPPRGSSVPPRATTPVSQMGSSTYGKGVVTPAVRPAPGGAKSAPNKRMKMSDSGDEGHGRNGGRAPFGASRGVNALGTSQRRDISPSKIPGSGRTHQRGNSGGATSSLPRPVPSVAMPVPKPGTQHHALGHGRLPTGGVFTAASSSAASSYSSGGFPVGIRTASAYGSGSSVRGYGSSTSGSRYPSGGSGVGKSSYADRNPKVAARVRRESFRPRPSMDGHEVAAGRWTGGFAGLREEDEGY
ncbi:microtubule associated protein [Moniliophthora roreri MCA 2997]|uniref:Microtubule associated protein n=2 Tax=Moniliophthora roreri TaxID=221103 RepID=V2XUV9_MONRO|nr:microtubule associated protein [Moniliophthora roreri MCA 2997]KAI3615188.1 microtubule associated protein [Moniliophthora roreri]